MGLAVRGRDSGLLRGGRRCLAAACVLHDDGAGVAFLQRERVGVNTLRNVFQGLGAGIGKAQRHLAGDGLVDRA